MNIVKKISLLQHVDGFQQLKRGKVALPRLPPFLGQCCAKNVVMNLTTTPEGRSCGICSRYIAVVTSDEKKLLCRVGNDFKTDYF